MLSSTLKLLEKAKDNVRRGVEPRIWSAYVETAELGRKAVDVARELGMKPGAVYQAKHSVLTALRREIEAMEDDAVDVPTPESIRRHTDISFPARVRVGKTYNLRVQIIPAEETLPTGEIKVASQAPPT